MKEFLHVPDTADLWVGNIVWRDQDVITRPIGDYLYDVDLSKIDSQEIKQNEQQDNTLDFALKQFFSQSSGRSRISQTRSATPWCLNKDLLFGKIFAEIRMKMREIGPMEACVPSASLLDPPMQKP